MRLMIEKHEVFVVAHELSDLTGETVTEAVITSLRERLECLRSEQREGVAAALLAIGRDVARRLPPPWLESDSDELLYAKDGLPK